MPAEMVRQWRRRLKQLLPDLLVGGYSRDRDARTGRTQHPDRLRAMEELERTAAATRA